MKSIIKNVLLVGGVTLFANSFALAQTPKHFRGNVCIQTMTAACAGGGWSVGGCAAARIVPPNYAGNGNRTGISLFWAAYAQQFTLPVGTLVGPTFKAVNVTQIGNGASTYRASARIVGQVPANPGAAIFMSSTIDINGFDPDYRACNVRLRISGQRFPLP